MQQSILFCLIVVKCEKISVEYGVIFLILQQVRRATSWVSAGRMRPAGRMLCTPGLTKQCSQPFFWTNVRKPVSETNSGILGKQEHWCYRHCHQLGCQSICPVQSVLVPSVFNRPNAFQSPTQ